MADSMQRYAVVTGANKGIGLEICKQLASKGIMVVLTARNEKRGLEAVENLKNSGLSDHLVFHQLDVNNSGIAGVNFDALIASGIYGSEEGSETIWSKVTENHETAEECLKTNYYGAKRTTEALIPLLQLSDLPRIVNLSSSSVLLKHMTGEHLKGLLAGFTTEEKLNELLNEYLKDFKEGSLESKGWSTAPLSAYTVSKVAMNAYTRILAKKYPNFCINCVCPGFVKTDINFNTGKLTVEEGAKNPVKLALLPKGGLSGLFFVQVPESRQERVLSSFSTSMEEVTKRYAVVTGSNKGIGLEICKQLASKGIMVVLTARDEKKGLAAVEKLKECGLSDNVVFHQLDVVNPATIASLVEFIKTQFGKLDILVNNAGIIGIEADVDALSKPGTAQMNWRSLMNETPEIAEECLQTNYYGAKRMCESFIPLLQLSDSPRIVNVSSEEGKLKNISNEWAKADLNDAENLTEQKVDEVLSEYMKDFKEGSLEPKGWPDFKSAYILSKAAMNAYTRILAKKYPNFGINCVAPGHVKTDLTYNTGIITVEEGAEGPVRLALLPNGGPSGLFFVQKEESDF
ncbi:hypothetical protein REPUB_Repub17cG0162900 [Reevesia pubescens]